MLHPGKNIRLFKSDFLERFSYVHPIVPIAFWGPIIAWLFGTGLYNKTIELGSSALLAIGGLAVWTVSEYLLHRFVFHFKPRTPFQERLSFLLHGIHHEDPNDQRRLLMPPVAGVVIASFFYVLFTATLGEVNMKPFFAGFLTGYLAYDYTHFAVHYMRPKSQFMKNLKQHHMLHHFTTPEKRFGVSMVFWDSVFRTRG